MALMDEIGTGEGADFERLARLDAERTSLGISSMSWKSPTRADAIRRKSRRHRGAEERTSGASAPWRWKPEPEMSEAPS